MAGVSRGVSCASRRAAATLTGHNQDTRCRLIPYRIEIIGVPYRIRTGVAAVRELQDGRSRTASDEYKMLISRNIGPILCMAIHCDPAASL